jgi:hypothetical protein
MQTDLLSPPGSTPAVPRPPLVIIPSASAAKPSNSLSRYQLFEQILAYGFVWRPRDPTNLINIANYMATRSDEVGQCLNRGGTAQAEIVSLLQRDVATDRANLTRQKFDEGTFHLLVDLPERSMVSSAGYCVESVQKILPFYYYVYPPQERVSTAIASRSIEAANKQDAKEAIEWRLPSVIEAFAIATLILRDQDMVPTSFWTSHNGLTGLFTINKSAAGVDVDHTWSIPPNVKAARLILVHY